MSMPGSIAPTWAMRRVLMERLHQNKKWGVQHHQDGTGRIGDATASKLQRELVDSKDDPTWRDILSEEVCEAYAETDYNLLIEELTQVAAVAVAWIEDILSRETEK